MHVRVRYAPHRRVSSISAASGPPDKLPLRRSNGGTFILRLEDTDRTRYSTNTSRTYTIPSSGSGYLGTRARRRWTLRALCAVGTFSPLPGKGKGACRRRNSLLVLLRRGAPRQAASRAGDSETSDMGYDRHCRSLDPAESSARVAAGEKAVIRLKIP